MSGFRATTAPWDAFDYPALLGQAQASLARRIEAYPEWVRSGRMASDAAADDIAAWRMILAEWTWIVEGTGDLPPRDSVAARLAAVDLSLERISFDALRRGGEDLVRQHELLVALRWHLTRTDPDGQPKVHRFAALTRAVRAELAAKPAPEQERQNPERKAA